ncbi:hypothetical protein MPTK1_4g15190 [Marchantia polymorpha subsp. ruderalis]|uniref:Uncharacterized protein n=2 Tax=Marchantia polymorpha TaxID=3197 RepID=A0AAF6BA43_MARPO|nr:hypothetical protein MARPO_0119s0043 [Marchantia polymorpha]BBN08877.1 hypothetical protein Mp_4g15190 [Marchantia polymorpha subsp. ruderalis]|eukprot:PTQ30843.1 hypothetical protein MARPO_0119s0043 [Marchantia polymorpha]
MKSTMERRTETQASKSKHFTSLGQNTTQDLLTFDVQYLAGRKWRKWVLKLREKIPTVLSSACESVCKVLRVHCVTSYEVHPGTIPKKVLWLRWSIWRMGTRHTR